ncbi:MAG: GntR family transcriptional regulator [Gammaproteobacteria bacterium]|nr:GntR family transcriptional regulator [Gammaproteobacteria bacterium]MDH3578106.1 GntR family transcriptional regulator [Gammaproteobacteria bacterium]
MTAAVDKAYAALRQKIFSGELAAGDRLKERKICEELDVSRTPVREALRRLQADGLVVIEPNRGGVVAGINASEAAEIYSLGMLLESFGAGLAATRATEEDLTELDRIIAAMEAALRTDSPVSRSTYLELDSDLHRQIVAITGNHHLGRLIRQVVGLPVLIQAFTHYSHTDLLRSLEQHRTIVAALRAGDAEWAEAAMRAHILSGRSVTFPRSKLML